MQSDPCLIHLPFGKSIVANGGFKKVSTLTKNPTFGVKASSARLEKKVSLRKIRTEQVPDEAPQCNRFFRVCAELIDLEIELALFYLFAVVYGFFATENYFVLKDDATLWIKTLTTHGFSKGILQDSFTSILILFLTSITILFSLIEVLLYKIDLEGSFGKYLWGLSVKNENASSLSLASTLIRGLCKRLYLIGPAIVLFMLRLVTENSEAHSPTINKLSLSSFGVLLLFVILMNLATLMSNQSRSLLDLACGSYVLKSKKAPKNSFQKGLIFLLAFTTLHLFTILYILS
jgi:hypothetical protein